ncbi:Fic/DOC family protein [Lacrimispora sp. 38-1]|uniref:Fic/DOC family protein n=1 Tax=Lacrimispora sp. 38-1 TaxID=3125778 RepID=UPI003CF402BE
MSDRVYCYPGSNVLTNKLNIRDLNRLNEAEQKLTQLRLNDLISSPIKGNFDLSHLQKIHQFLFQDLYSWAGEIRTVDIAKSNMFCKVQFIKKQADEIFGYLKADNYLAAFPKELFIQKSAYYFSEINALHPFREGNGRTQREFIRELAMQQGYLIHFSEVTAQEMLEASIASFVCKYDKMEALFEKMLQ